MAGYGSFPREAKRSCCLRHDLLTGVCDPVPIPYPIGANGLAYRHGSLFVANTEKALLLEIPVLKGGGLGDISVVADLSGPGMFGPAMLDGIALDVHGNIYAAVITDSSIKRVSSDGQEVETVATWEDGPRLPGQSGVRHWQG